jgi:hypothetical protein
LVFTIGNLNEGNAQLVKNYGLKMAVTSADQEFGMTLDTKRRVGFNIGAFAEWLDVPLFSVITQVEYTQRGTGQVFIMTGPSGPEPIGRKTLYSRLDYISVPVLAKLRFQTGLISPYILAGPRLDFLLGYKSDEGAFNTLYDKFKKTTFGASTGIGVQVESFLPVTLLAEARYNFDLTDSYDAYSWKVRNNALDFWLGIAI